LNKTTYIPLKIFSEVVANISKSAECKPAIVFTSFYNHNFNYFFNMKNYLFLSIVLLLSITACNKEDLNNSSNASKGFPELVSSSVTKTEIVSEINSLNIDFQKVANLLGLNSLNKDDFDYSNIKSIKIDNFTYDCAIVQYKYNNTAKISFVFPKVNGIFVKPMLVQKMKDRINYFDFKDNSLIIAREENSLVKFESQDIQFQVENVNSTLFRSGCGDAVIGCMSDAYSNHGWLSVALFIESAFIPETTVIIAAACAGKNC